MPRNSAVHKTHRHCHWCLWMVSIICRLECGASEEPGHCTMCMGLTHFFVQNQWQGETWLTPPGNWNMQVIFDWMCRVLSGRWPPCLACSWLQPLWRLWDFWTCSQCLWHTEGTADNFLLSTKDLQESYQWTPKTVQRFTGVGPKPVPWTGWRWLDQTDGAFWRKIFHQSVRCCLVYWYSPPKI